MKDTGFSVPADKLDRLPTAYWTNFETGEFGVFDDVENSRWSSAPALNRAPLDWSRRSTICSPSAR